MLPFLPRRLVNMADTSQGEGRELKLFPMNAIDW